MIRLKSGEKMLFASFRNRFALIPAKEANHSKADKWNTYAEAEKHLKSQIKIAPQIKSLAPFEIFQVKGSA